MRDKIVGSILVSIPFLVIIVFSIVAFGIVKVLIALGIVLGIVAVFVCAVFGVFLLSDGDGG